MELHTKRMASGLLVVLVAVLLGATTAGQQSAAQAHRARAQAAAEQDFQGLFSRVCAERPVSAAGQRGASPSSQPPQAAAPVAQPGQTASREAPPRAEWHAEPTKVFDNLYFVGTREHGAWAVTTSDGIIIVDTLYDYAVEDEIAGGLKTLGLDPKTIKYVVISHGHGDHHGGAKYLQDTFGARIVMGPEDWNLVERDSRSPRPRRDIVATDGQKLTLGDTTIMLYITPGHTPTTISSLVPVRDGASRHLAAEWGGTLLLPATSNAYVQSYIDSAIRFRELAAKAGADVLLTNHTLYDRTLMKLEAVKTRRPAAPHPYVIGSQAVGRYLTVAEECARAELASR